MAAFFHMSRHQLLHTFRQQGVGVLDAPSCDLLLKLDPGSQRDSHLNAALRGSVGNPVRRPELGGTYLPLKGSIHFDIQWLPPTAYSCRVDGPKACLSPTGQHRGFERGRVYRCRFRIRRPARLSTRNELIVWSLGCGAFSKAHLCLFRRDAEQMKFRGGARNPRPRVLNVHSRRVED